MRWPPHVYHPTHGPQVWPWWKLVTIHIAGPCSHDPADYFWITPISYNIWVYTRWGALCFEWRVRHGVYRHDEDGRISNV